MLVSGRLPANESTSATTSTAAQPMCSRNVDRPSAERSCPLGVTTKPLERPSALCMNAIT